MLDTSQGEVRAKVLISCTGPLVEPKLPDFPGLERFQGPAFHSARWDHDVDLTGKRVASIGTGASAIQYVPAIAPDVEQLYVVQRTPPWVMPHSARPVTRFEKRLYRAVPAVQRAVRGAIYAARELLVLGFVKRPKGMKLLEKIAHKHRERSLRDPALIAQTTPDYTLGCKRILPSNDWYPALARDNVELVTEGVTEVREHSIVTADGRELEVDALVFGTGFHVVDMPVGRLVHGRDGRALADVWDGSPRAHLGSTVPGLPEPLHRARPEHRPRAQLDGLHDRVPDRLRDGRAARDARARRGHRRGPAGGRGRVQRRGPAAHAGHGLDHGLHELVPGREGQQPDAVAGLDVAVPAPHGAL